MAVAHLHANGVLHADVKPENCLLCELPRQPAQARAVTPHAAVMLKLCDFGLARAVPDVRNYKQTGNPRLVPFTQLSGTQGYQAPELLQRRAFGVEVDMWSVGVILFEMLFGRRPFNPPHSCLTQPLQFDEERAARPGSLVRKRKSVSAQARDLVERLLQVDPAVRATAQQALAHPWFDRVKGEFDTAQRIAYSIPY